jgi:hypothetical protein
MMLFQSNVAKEIEQIHSAHYLSRKQAEKYVIAAKSHSSKFNLAR